MKGRGDGVAGSAIQTRLRCCGNLTGSFPVDQTGRSIIFEPRHVISNNVAF